MPSNEPSKIKLILFSLIATVLFFFFLETSARLFLAMKEQSLSFILYGFTDTRKEKLRVITGQDGKMLYVKTVPSTNRLNPVNRLGFRGREIRERKDGTVRIICLGSSTTYGTGLDYDETYPKLLQDKLDRKFGENHFEVINAGQPGLTLSHIIALAKNEIIRLNPDLVILMNINNNFAAPGFNFVGIGAEKDSTLILKLKKYLVKYLALGFVADEALKSFIDRPEVRFFKHFDWQAFSRALMSPHNIWQAKFKQNLDQLMEILFESNPSLQVILLEEACNYADYPVMEPPFERAKEMLKKVSCSHRNIHTLSVQETLLDAAKRGEKVWQEPWWDPLHLSKRGNDIVADTLGRYLSAMPKN
jgi:lysophospholipase L1-like esterase